MSLVEPVPDPAGVPAGVPERPPPLPLPLANPPPPLLGPKLSYADIGGLVARGDGTAAAYPKGECWNGGAPSGGKPPRADSGEFIDEAGGDVAEAGGLVAPPEGDAAPAPGPPSVH